MSTAASDLCLPIYCSKQSQDSYSNVSSSNGNNISPSSNSNSSLLQSLKVFLRIPSKSPRTVRHRRAMSEAPSSGTTQQSLSTASQKPPQVYVVGSPSPKSPFLRIAHVSDTCGLPDSGYATTFAADVVVHSGNLCSGIQALRKPFFRDSDFEAQLKTINEYFAGLPHRYKIFVPGPNEAALTEEDRELIQVRLPNCIYLQDSGCIIEGVRFHGLGCTGRRFRRPSAESRTAWSNVPDNVDVLVSHAIPTTSLYDDLISRLRPKMLLYGSRLHRSSRTDQPVEENSVKFKDNVIFSNGHAGNSGCKRGLFDFYPDDQTPRVTELPQVSPAAVTEAFSRSRHGSGGDGNGRKSGGLLRCISS